MQKPKKWTEVYPQGTKEGDEEQKLFIALARHPKYEWRSVSAIEKLTGISKKRIEEILSKYHKLGMVFQSPSNEDNWGYWERVPEMLNADKRSIPAKDQDKRIKDASGSVKIHSTHNPMSGNKNISIAKVKVLNHINAVSDLMRVQAQRRAARPEPDSYEELKSIDVCLSMNPVSEDDDFWKPITLKSDKADDMVYFESTLAQALYGKPSDQGCFQSIITGR